MRALLSLLFILVFFFSQPLSASIKVIFERTEFAPHPEDPSQYPLYKELPREFLQELSKKNDIKIAMDEPFSLIDKMSNAKGVINEDIVKTENFIYTNEILVGAGEQGDVYLAQHIPSRIYSAVKVVKTSLKNVEAFSQYRALKRIDRLYAYYANANGDARGRQTLYLYMPLFIGESVSKYWNATKEIYNNDLLVEHLEHKNHNEIKYKNWRRNASLIKSLIEEARYCGKRGATHTDCNLDNTLVINSTSNNFKVIFIDLDTQKPLSEEEINIYRKIRYFQYFLGLKPYLGRQDERTKEWDIYNLEKGVLLPSPIQKFNTKIAAVLNGKKDDFSLKNCEKLFKELMREMEALEQNKDIQK